MKHSPFKLTAIFCAAVLLVACATPESSQTHNARNDTAAASHTEQAAPRAERINLAEGLYQVAFSARHNTIYVASAGNFEEGSPPSAIYFLDPQTLAVKGHLPLERKAFALTLDDAADRLYVGNAVDSSITVIDTAKKTVLNTVQLAKKVKRIGPNGKEMELYTHYPRELVLDKKHNRLFAPGLWFQDSVLYVISLDTMKVEKEIPGFGYVARGAVLNEAENTLYVSNFQGQLFTVDTGSLAVSKKAEVAADQLINLEFDQKNHRVLATDVGDERTNTMRKNAGKLEYSVRGEGNRVLVINPDNGQVEHSIPTGKAPLDLLLDEQRQRLYVTTREAGTVEVYDNRTRQLLHSIELPAHPNSLTLNPSTGDVYVTIKNGEDAAKGTKEGLVRLSF
ncbi:YncE family protein [Alcaligenes parafaecalis]|uniref:YncE family protein n=1 Tax=Alcaligenes parafaecalis TaxID=171260 RepID=A0ABT3VI70_9BURK|nr:YncE family protein [Alcaligenes parafaecalis]MCX5462973.1 YncE family protein [Alcaligenes parafaecalis]